MRSSATKRNTDWWEAKLETRCSRERRATAELDGLGWTLIRVWEHETASEAAQKMVSALFGLENYVTADLVTGLL